MNKLNKILYIIVISCVIISTYAMERLDQYPKQEKNLDQYCAKRTLSQHVTEVTYLSQLPVLDLGYPAIQIIFYRNCPNKMGIHYTQTMTIMGTAHELPGVCIPNNLIENHMNSAYRFHEMDVRSFDNEIKYHKIPANFISFCADPKNFYSFLLTFIDECQQNYIKNCYDTIFDFFKQDYLIQKEKSNYDNIFEYAVNNKDRLNLSVLRTSVDNSFESVENYFCTVLNFCQSQYDLAKQRKAGDFSFIQNALVNRGLGMIALDNNTDADFIQKFTNYNANDLKALQIISKIANSHSIHSLNNDYYIPFTKEAMPSDIQSKITEIKDFSNYWYSILLNPELWDLFNSSLSIHEKLKKYLLEDPSDYHNHFEQDLIFKRNTSWINVLKQNNIQKSVLDVSIACGTNHLPDLLQKIMEDSEFGCIKEIKIFDTGKFKIALKK